MPSKRIIPRVCRACDRDFLARATRVEKGFALYCSRACRGGRRAPIRESEDGLTALVPLQRGDSILAYAVIDAADVEWASRWRWTLDDKGYAERSNRINGRSQHIRLHRELLGLTHGDGFEGDHINRDRLDNRRSNLRAIPLAGNRQNKSSHHNSSSKYRGVSWAPDRRKWRASITDHGKRIHLGQFSDEQTAAEAARAARSRLMPYAVD